MTIGHELRELRGAVREAGWVLTEATAAAVAELGRLCADDRERLAEIKDLARDYGKEEFLLNADGGGAAVPATEATLSTVRAEAEALGLWLREASVGGKPVLLVARWLCHLAGFRHRAVHIFLDHPTYPEYTFVQIRSFAKLKGPGALDVLVGGHAKGTDTLDETVAEELKEELNLDADADVDALVHLGDYDYHGSSERFDPWNNEYRAVYEGRLRAGALSRIRFADGEVACLCLFSVPELERYLATYPDRVASGLHGSFPVYARMA